MNKSITEKYLITGGAGFIGANFIHYLFNKKSRNIHVLNLDKLTYAGNLDNLSTIKKSYPDLYTFIKGDIANSKLIQKVLQEFKPNYIVNFAAESHVDRSIDGPEAFIKTNIMGTFVLLKETLRYFKNLRQKKGFRFLHISTDEVYGELGKSGKFTENTAYNPSSPYSASKASSDHLVSAWHKTYQLPALVTNCSNNYGPYQFLEKLIPLMIINAVSGLKLPIYGTGQNIRDWIYVNDHCDGLYTALKTGRLGETYNIGGNQEKKNIDVVITICKILDEISPLDNNRSYQAQMKFVKDRPGHDFRYAIDNSKISKELNWKPKETFTSGLKKTIQWYLDNQDWWKKIQKTKYNQERLGLN